jgi:hypothetical protein
MASIGLEHVRGFAARRATVFAAAVVAASSIGGGFITPAEAADTAGWQPLGFVKIKEGTKTFTVHMACRRHSALLGTVPSF